MKYCEVVRDIVSKPGDWLFYDEQFRYIRQSAPVSYPWDTIHWELWLRAVTNSRARPAMPADKVSPRSRKPPDISKGNLLGFSGREVLSRMPLSPSLLQMWLTPPRQSMRAISFPTSHPCPAWQQTVPFGSPPCPSVR